MAGKVIYICDDSILGFAFVNLLNAYKRGEVTKTTISRFQFEKLRRQIKSYAEMNKGPNDIIIMSNNKRECYTRKELETGIRQEMYKFDDISQCYIPIRSLEYLLSAYNTANTPTTFSYNIYNNPGAKQILIPSQAQK